MDVSQGDLYWEASNVSISSFRDDLTYFAEHLTGKNVEFIEDIDGCRLKQDRVVFGIGNKAGLINYDGIGAGYASFQQADICCAIAYHANAHNISLTAADDRVLSPVQAISLSMQYASSSMLEVMHKLGYVSLRHTLTSLSNKQVTF